MRSSQEQQVSPLRSVWEEDRALAEGKPSMLFLWSKYVRPVWGLLAFGMAADALAGVSALMIPQLLRSLVDGIAARPSVGLLWQAVGLMTVLALLEAFMLLARRRFTIRPSTKIERSMRENLFARLQRLPAGFHDAWPSGQLLSRSMSDLGLVRRYLAFGAVITLSSLVLLVVGMVMLYLLDWRFFAIFSLIVLPVTLAGVVFRTKYHAASRKVMDLQGDVATTVEESVHGIRILKAFGRADHSAGILTNRLGRLRTAEINKGSTLGWFIGVITALPALVLAGSLVLGAFLVRDASMSPGTIVAFFAITQILIVPLEDMGQLIGMYVATKASMQRHTEIVKVPVEIDSPEDPERPEARGELSLRDVSFSYPDSPAHSEPVLRSVDLTLEPGETLALIGETGSGKSTLLQLIPRLYAQSGGSIEVDGVPVERLSLEDLRTRVSIAFEEATLFSDTVEKNVLLGVPDLEGDARSERLETALKTAQAHFVWDLPEGVHTQIGEEGLSLSGGQRQRLALARAIAAAPSIMLLDDPLSALDVRTEEKVIAQLGSVLAGTTTLIVAHRPSTVALADRVALLHEGRISAVGTHEDLLTGNALYRHLISTLEDTAAREEASRSIENRLEGGVS